MNFSYNPDNLTKQNYKLFGKSFIFIRNFCTDSDLFVYPQTYPNEKPGSHDYTTCFIMEYPATMTLVS